MALSTTPGKVDHWQVARGAADGSVVSSLADSGSGGHTLASGAGSAFYRPAGFATSKPAIDYPASAGVGDGPCFWKETPIFAGFSTLTVGAVATAHAGAPGNAVLFARELGFKVDLTPERKARLLVSSDGTTWAVNSIGAGTVSLGVPHAYVLLVGGGSVSLRVDGIQVAVGSFTGTIGSNSSDFAIGAVNRNGSETWHGLIGDVLASSQKLAGADLSTFEADLLASATNSGVPPTLSVSAPAKVVWPDQIPLTITSDGSVSTAVKARPADTIATPTGSTSKTPMLTPDFSGGLGVWVFTTTASGSGGTASQDTAVEVVAEFGVVGPAPTFKFFPARQYLVGP